MSPKNKSVNYINNHDFSHAVVEYVRIVNTAQEKGEAIPIVPDYIARCFLDLAEGLSHKSNFIRYTYREEMVMDAVENCLKAIHNYNIEAATRTGKPNAFAYFTQISWYAFLRRIDRENKQRDIRLKYLAESGVENFIDGEDMNDASIMSFIGQLKDRIDKVKDYDVKIKEYKKKETKKKRTVHVDSDLTGFFE
jgi:hypothetical protein